MKELTQALSRVAGKKAGECGNCGGSGKITKRHRYDHVLDEVMTGRFKDTCPTCKGSGRLQLAIIEDCDTFHNGKFGKVKVCRPLTEAEVEELANQMTSYPTKRKYLRLYYLARDHSDTFDYKGSPVKLIPWEDMV